MKSRFHILILLVLSLGVYVATAAQPALLDDADASHALVSREMLQRGDWVVMYQDGIRYLEKAPLHYWMVAVSYKLFGQGAFQTRLPLVMSVVGLVLMVYFFARRWFGETAAFYSGLVICTSVGTWLFTRVMVPEAIFALELTALFYLFLRAWNGTLSPRVGYWGASVVMALASQEKRAGKNAKCRRSALSRQKKRANPRRPGSRFLFAKMEMVSASRFSRNSRFTNGIVDGKK